MTRAPLVAAAAGALAVLGGWEALAAVEAELRGEVGRALALLRRAGAEGARPSAAERRRLGLLAAGVCLLGGLLLSGPVAGVALAACGPGGARGLVRRRERRWRAALTRGAPGAARALADAVGAGHSVRGALTEAGRHVAGAAGAELRTTARALALGAETEAEVERLRVRAGGEAWDTVAAAVLLQREAGGDLARLLRRIAETQEDAARLERDARAATAQARFTGLVICGLPLGALALALVAAPAAVGGVLRAPASAVLGGLALALQLGSLWAIRRLSRPAGVTRAVVLAALAGILTSGAIAELSATPRARRRRGGLVRALAALGHRLGAPRPPAELAARLAAAGAPFGLGERDVVALKAGVALAVLGALGPLAAAAPTRLGILLAAAAAGGGYLLPDAWLRRRGRARAREMERELPDVLELVRVAVEAGLPLTRAIAEVGRRRRGLLAAELRRASREIALGRPRAEALAALEARAPAAGVPALVAAIGRAERLGAPLGDALAAQARDARAARAARMREAAERASPKIQLVIALGLVPSVMLLVAAALLASLAR